MALGMCAVGLTASALDLQGDGTAANPYQIGSYADLKAFANAVNNGESAACAVLTADFAAKNDPADADNATDRVPIGNEIYPYTGAFDGRGHTITGLSTPAYAEERNVGLFGHIVEDSVVENIGQLDCAFIGGVDVGSIVGYNCGTVQNCYSTGTVTGTSCVGGIVGGNEAIILNCYNTGAVSGRDQVAGISDDNGNDGDIRNCRNSGAVTANRYAGGIVGANSEKIQNCHNIGAITADELVGGVAADNASSGIIKECSNTGDLCHRQKHRPRGTPGG